MQFSVALGAITVTQLSPASNPRSTWSGAQGLSSSFSPKHSVNLPGKPCVALSISPGAAPPMLRRTRRTARPIEAFARFPGPRQLAPLLMPISLRIGPFTITPTPTGLVVVWML